MHWQNRLNSFDFSNHTAVNNNVQTKSAVKLDVVVFDGQNQLPPECRTQSC
jgi:hypothetical protein